MGFDFREIQKCSTPEIYPNFGKRLVFVRAELAEDAAGRAALALVAESQPALLRLLENLDPRRVVVVVGGGVQLRRHQRPVKLTLLLVMMGRLQLLLHLVDTASAAAAGMKEVRGWVSDVGVRVSCDVIVTRHLRSLNPSVRLNENR